MLTNTDKQELQFEWNAASDFDWPKIRRLFVAAYVSAYKDMPVDQLDLNPHVVEEAQRTNTDPLTKYFEHCFDDEIVFIKAQKKSDKFKINYLTIKFHDQPIAFIITQLNYKSGRVYIRWNTVSPSFHRHGLGRIMLSAVAKYYENSGLELYTRAANTNACEFYKKSGLVAISKYDFSEPEENDGHITGAGITKYALLWLKGQDYHNTIYPPLDERIVRTDHYAAFCRTSLKYR